LLVFIVEGQECEVVKTYAKYLEEKFKGKINVRIIDVKTNEGRKFIKSQGLNIDYVPCIISYENALGHNECMDLLRKIENSMR
jgi:hypothetical protein